MYVWIWTGFGILGLCLAAILVVGKVTERQSDKKKRGIHSFGWARRLSWWRGRFR